jgi:hypothetical protein
MQCDIGFLMMWRREIMERKEAIASRNNHLMNKTTTSRDNSTTNV